MVIEVSHFKEQILQLAGLACHEDEEKSRTELLEKLCNCNKYTLIELCRSFDIPGSTGTKKDELVTILMEFLMEHCSGIDGTDPDKKVMKRKRKMEGVNLSGGKPSKKKSHDGTSLETRGEDEADGRKGKKMASGDLKPRKQAMKPSRDELKQAVFSILDTANFATMTFGDVVKAVDKYFGKDLFERKPLIRSLIEEELYRLADEAEKKELEEEEAIEAKARAEQAAKDIAKGGIVESDTDNANELQTGEVGKCMDASKNENRNSMKGVIGGISVNAAENTNSDPATESSHGGKSEVDTKNDSNIDEYTKDCMDEKFMQNANGSDVVEITRSGMAKTAKQNDNGNTIGSSEDGKTEESKIGENDDINDGRTEECRSVNDHTNAKNVGDREAEESKTNEHVKYAEDCIAQEADGNQKFDISHGYKCCKSKEVTEDVNSEHLKDAADDDRAEDSQYNLE